MFFHILLVLSPCLQVPVFDEGKWILNKYIPDFYSLQSFKALEANGLTLGECVPR